jgi:LCP family protein required for cell wall assembly
MGATDGHLRGSLLSPFAALLSVVLPGAGHLAIGARFRPAVVIAAVGNVAAMIAMAVVLGGVHGNTGFGDVIADRATFLLVALLLVVMAVTRLWSALDSAWMARPQGATWQRGLSGVAVVILTLAGVTPMVIAADYVWRTDQAVERVFGSEEAVTANPGAIATTTVTSTTSVHTDSTTTGPSSTAPSSASTSSTSTSSTSTSSTSTTSTTVAPFAGVDRVNVLLLGGDAGPGRYSLRTDSMIVVSIDPVTGDTAMISVPRNLERLEFPPGTPLAEKFPRGFDNLANAVYTYVDRHRDLAGGGEDAGAQAIKQGIAQFLGVPINYYVMVDMAGFVDIVDALGGIDIFVPKRVPTAGNPPRAKHRVPKWIDKGQQHMDGTLALGYARSREADSDYQRMARQRCVLASIASAATPQAVASGLPALMDAFGDAVRSDIPRERLGDFAQLIDRYSAAGGLQAVRTLHLAPPLVKPFHWDPAAVRELVAAAFTVQPVGELGASPVLADACR